MSSNLLLYGDYCDEKILQSNQNLPNILFEGADIFVTCVILLLSLFSFVLTIKYIFDMIGDYMIFKREGKILRPVLVESNKKNESSNSLTLIKILNE